MVHDMRKYRKIAAIACPAALESLVSVAVISIDTKMVAALGKPAVSAVALAAQPKLFFLSIFFALGIAVSVFVAQAYGKGNREEANGYFISILKIAILLAILLGCLFAFISEPFMHLCSRQTETVAMSATFFEIVMGFVVFQAVSIVINGALRGLGKTNVTFVSSLALAAVDILFNYLLIEGRYGFPRLEVAGNGIATVMGTAAACGVGLAVLLRHPDFLSLKGFWGHRLLADKGILLQIRTKAGNTVFENLAMRTGFLLTSIVVSTLPASETAVYFVAMILMNCSFAFGDGMQSAVVALVGRSIGAGAFDEAREYFRLSIRSGLALSMLLGATYIGGSDWFFQGFFSDQEAITRGRTASIFAAIISCLQIVRIISVAAMRGTGDMKTPRQVASFCVLVLNPGLSFLFACLLGMGSLGIWQAILASQAAWTALTLPRAGDRMKSLENCTQ